MGELDSKPFQESCKRKYSADEADEKALVLCSQWEEYLKDPDWHPFKIIQVKEDVHQRKVADQIYNQQYLRSPLHIHLPHHHHIEL
ncbi:hypothetical protein IFM89_020357 [Coptis chinensis]|uniref:Factor of DNA methylation 1-5/IDN2 domain-containing protein n=1 Tax=Coptis chinensis TaxID=261450 RepID=A0A835HL63_9MAGN|nr:hypothetical protein IFM89_020357 [Coptis chinensis]